MFCYNCKYNYEPFCRRVSIHIFWLGSVCFDSLIIAVIASALVLGIIIVVVVITMIFIIVTVVAYESLRIRLVYSTTVVSVLAVQGAGGGRIFTEDHVA